MSRVRAIPLVFAVVILVAFARSSSGQSAERPPRVVIIGSDYPGTSGGELLVDLQPGRRYLVICTLRDAPDASQHMTLGMIGSFEAR